MPDLQIAPYSDTGTMSNYTDHCQEKDKWDCCNITEDVIPILHSQQNLDPKDDLIEPRCAKCYDEIVLRREAHLVKRSESAFNLVILLVFVSFP